MGVLLVVVLLFLANCVASNDSPSSCKIYNFGDSNTDAGWKCGGDKYGPRCRLSDNKIYLDYFCDRLKIDLLPCYKDDNNMNFTSGANFAAYGATIKASSSEKPLRIQVEQFESLHNQTYKEAIATGKWPTVQQEFRNAVFSIDIGQNDCSNIVKADRAAYREKTPNLVRQIEEAVNKLYKLGGRKFVIYNTGPSSYLPMRWPNTDEICNDVAKSFNKDLSLMCDKLRSYKKDVIILYGDMFSVKLDLYVNFSEYGFSSRGTCYHADKCNTVFWDLAHYSDEANNITATKLWTGEYWSPNTTNMHDLCDMVM